MPSDDSGYGIEGKDTDSDDRGSSAKNYRGGKQFMLKKEGKRKSC